MSQQQSPALWAEFIKAVKQEVVPAIGCTEPISLALASAIAASYLEQKPERIEAKVSMNLMKNGMGVTVPGTGMVGLPIAAAVGAIGGDAKAGLEVLKHLSPDSVSQGKVMLVEGRVSVCIAECSQTLYSEATLYAGSDKVRVCIADSHTHVVRIEKNDRLLFETDRTGTSLDQQGYCMESARADDVYQFAINAPFEDLEFILQAATLNSALSVEGLKSSYGLHIGATLQKQMSLGLLSPDLLTQIMIRTTSASDARMGGALLPAMSNSGSGNQGIAATMPVVVVAEFVGADKEKLARALMLSHLMAIYIHTKLPKLSALCAATTASMGAAAGMAWLLSDRFDTVGMAISSMIGDVSGMICDGASNSCAMKVSTSASSAYKAVLMALDGCCVTGNEGIVESDVDKSIANLGALACGSMCQTDTQIIEIMTRKAS